MGPSSKDFFDLNRTHVKRIFGERVIHLGSTFPYALTCEYPLVLGLSTQVSCTQTTDKIVKGLFFSSSFFLNSNFHYYFRFIMKMCFSEHNQAYVLVRVQYCLNHFDNQISNFFCIHKHYSHPVKNWYVIFKKMQFFFFFFFFSSYCVKRN